MRTDISQFLFGKNMKNKIEDINVIHVFQLLYPCFNLIENFQTCSRKAPMQLSRNKFEICTTYLSFKADLNSKQSWQRHCCVRLILRHWLWPDQTKVEWALARLSLRLSTWADIKWWIARQLSGFVENDNKENEKNIRSVVQIEIYLGLSFGSSSITSICKMNWPGDFGGNAHRGTRWHSMQSFGGLFHSKKAWAGTGLIEGCNRRKCF